MPKAKKPLLHPLDIERRAYEIYIARGRPEGRSLDHWLEAEHQCSASARQKGTARLRKACSAVANSSVPDAAATTRRLTS